MRANPPRMAENHRFGQLAGSKLRHTNASIAKMIWSVTDPSIRVFRVDYIATVTSARIRSMRVKAALADIAGIEQEGTALVEILANHVGYSAIIDHLEVGKDSRMWRGVSKIRYRV